MKHCKSSPYFSSNPKNSARRRQASLLEATGSTKVIQPYIMALGWYIDHMFTMDIVYIIYIYIYILTCFYDS